jgi:hypothetical protein
MLLGLPTLVLAIKINMILLYIVISPRDTDWARENEGVPPSFQTTGRRNVHLWARRPNNGPPAELLHNDSHTKRSSKTKHSYKRKLAS